MSVYLEASALWALYYGEPGGDTVAWILENYCPITLEWSILELCRAISKRLNEEEITKEEAEDLEAFILSDVQKLGRRKRMTLMKVTWHLMKEAYALIIPLNLYASDAAHLAAATVRGAQVMLVDDYHFKRLSGKVEKPKIVPITLHRERIIEKLPRQGS